MVEGEGGLSHGSFLRAWITFLFLCGLIQLAGGVYGEKWRGFGFVGGGFRDPLLRSRPRMHMR